MKAALSGYSVKNFYIPESIRQQIEQQRAAKAAADAEAKKKAEEAKKAADSKAKDDKSAGSKLLDRITGKDAKTDNTADAAKDTK